MKKHLSLILAVMLIFVTGCSDGKNSQPPLASNSVIVTDESIPNTAPDISGIVTSISYVREGITLLVEVPDNNANPMEGKVYVTVTPLTVLEDKGKNRYDDMKKIALGDTVSVWYTGNATNTLPVYAMARGIRVMSKNEDAMLSVAFGNSSVMASPVEKNISSSDKTSVFYGSYLTVAPGSTLSMRFTENPLKVSVTIPTDSSKESEAAKTTIYNFEFNFADNTCIIPAELTDGEYLIEVSADYPDRTDYYIFTLCVQ